MINRFAQLVVYCLVSTVPVTVALGAENWNQFRGPTGNGHSTAQSLPTKWQGVLGADGEVDLAKSEHVKWRTPVLGKAWSSPVVWGDQVWVTNAPADGKQLYAVCLDATSGKLVHDLTVFEIEKPQPLGPDRNGYASPTPVIEEGRIYVHFGAHGTAGLDTATGKTLWTRQDLECNHFRGPASSPIVWDDLLILTFDGFDLQYLVALNKETGKTVWKTDRDFNYGTDNGDSMKAYTTPQIAEVAGKPQLISPSAGCTAAYEPRTGKELWRLKSGGMNAASRPVIGGGLAFMSTADGGMQLFAVKLDGQPVENPEWKLSKGAPRYSSPILVDDLLYMANEGGIVTCVEAKNAKAVWQERLGGLFMPSPLYAAGKLYFFNEEGKCFVVAPGREFKLLATNEIPGGFMASPAVHGKALILRTKDAVWRIEE